MFYDGTLGCSFLLISWDFVLYWTSF